MTAARFLILFLTAFCVLCGSTFAQEPAASAAFEPPTGSVGRPVEYRVTITSQERIIGLPNLVPPDGLDLQPAGTIQRAVQVNGVDVKLTTLSFVAVPKKSGDIIVAAFDVEVDGKRVRVPEATLAVPAAPGGADKAYQPARAVFDIPDREFYVGEAINARLLFLSTADETPQYVQHISKTSGTVLFKPGRMARPGQFKVEGKDVSGIAMAVEITPLVDGVGDLNCEAIVQVQKLDPFGRRSGFATQSTLQSQTVKLRVLPLPKVDRPPGFTGAIGDFTVSQPKVPGTETEVGEPITLTFSLAGEGNLDSVPAPELAENPNWTAYRPTSELSRDDETGRVVKTFSYTLVPKREGRHGTPPLPFAYFNPVKKKFEDITIPPIPFLVKAAPKSAADDQAAIAAAAAASTPAGPVEPELALTGLAEKSGGWTSRLGPSFRWFLIAQLIPPAALLIFWMLRLRSEYLAAHPEILLRRRARAAARRALGEARSAARRGDAPAFLKAGTGALCEAATQVGSATATSLTPAEVLGALDGEAEQAARAIFNHAEASRYASAAATLPKPSALLPGLENAVAQLTARA